jgi:hypothetical protein
MPSAERLTTLYVVILENVFTCLSDRLAGPKYKLTDGFPGFPLKACGNNMRLQSVRFRVRCGVSKGNYQKERGQATNACPLSSFAFPIFFDLKSRNRSGRCRSKYCL